MELENLLKESFMSLASARPTLVSTLKNIFISWRGSGTTPDAQSIAWAQEKAEELANAIHAYTVQAQVNMPIAVIGVCPSGGGPLTGGQTSEIGTVS